MMNIMLGLVLLDGYGVSPLRPHGPACEVCAFLTTQLYLRKHRGRVQQFIFRFVLSFSFMALSKGQVLGVR